MDYLQKKCLVLVCHNSKYSLKLLQIILGEFNEFSDMGVYLKVIVVSCSSKENGSMDVGC